MMIRGRYRLAHQSIRALVTSLIFAVLFGISVPREALAADPFYEEQLRRGRRAYELGNFDQAVKTLRIAAFGLLEEPITLTEALIFLGLSEAASGERESFDETFTRIVELEERFSSYSRCDLPEPKQTLEEIIARRIDPERLRMTTAFAALGESRSEEPDGDTPSDRRKILRRTIKDNPTDIHSLLELARLELSDGRMRRARDYGETALRLDPSNAAAHCLTIDLARRADRCDEAMSSFPLCGGTELDPPTDAFVLGCLVDRDLLDEAAAFFARIPASRRATAEIAALGVGLPQPETEIQETAEGNEGIETESGDPDGSSPAELTREDASEAAVIRELLAQARQLTDLDEPIRRALALADRNPESRAAQYLAAEAVYRAGRWGEAADLFRRGGGPQADEPLLLFYYAVALFETGETDAAAEALRSALPALQRTDFVNAYARRILAE